MTPEDVAALMAALDELRELLGEIQENQDVLVSLLSGLPFLLGCLFGGIMIMEFFRRV